MLIALKISGICQPVVPCTTFDKWILWKIDCCWSHIFNFQRSQDLDEIVPPAHAEPSIPSSSRSAPVRGSVVNLLIHLADQLTRGFQSADGIDKSVASYKCVKNANCT
jgi:hypothetical protein